MVRSRCVWTSSAAVLALIVSAACGDDSDPSSPSDPEIIDTNQTVGATVFPGLIVRAGAVLTVTGSQVEIQGDLVVEPGASIHGTSDPFNLIIRGDLMLEGTVSSVGHLVLVDDVLLIQSISALNASHTESLIQVLNPGSPASGLSEWRITGETTAGPAPAPVARSAPALVDEGMNGMNGRTNYLEMAGNLFLGSPPGAAANVINVENGEAGEGLPATCDGVGGTGGRGGRLELRAVTITIGNTTFFGGNGGPGGDATGSGCPDGSLNTGGVGGDPGTFELVATSQFRIDGTVSFTGWNAGDGGDGTIGGADGDPGASVTGNGGDGGVVSQPFSGSGMTFNTGASLFYTIGDGGSGGTGTATGGNGTVGACIAATEIASKSGDGGTGTANGGKGGDVTVTVTLQSGPISTFSSFSGGDGGTADATGGTGADGVPCPRVGGDGGHGGDAPVTTAVPGTSNAGLNGTPGTTTTDGGDGGDGGDSEGTGGTGGDAGCPGGEPGAGGAGGAGGVSGAGGQPCPS